MSKFIPIYARGGSIVDVLNAAGIDSSFENRKRIAQSMGLSNYKGSAKDNIYLASVLKDKYTLEDIPYDFEDESIVNPKTGVVEFEPIHSKSNNFRQRLNELESQNIQQVRSKPIVKPPVKPISVPAKSVEPNLLEYIQQRQPDWAKGANFTPSNLKGYNWYERNISSPLENRGVNVDAFETGLEGASYLTGAGALLKGASKLPLLLRNARIAAVAGAKSSKKALGKQIMKEIEQEAKKITDLSNKFKDVKAANPFAEAFGKKSVTVLKPQNVRDVASNKGVSVIRPRFNLGGYNPYED